MSFNTPISLGNMLRLKEVYYLNTLDDRATLKDIQIKASKLKRTHIPLSSSEATANYSVTTINQYTNNQKTPRLTCSNCTMANVVCDGAKLHCGRCVKTQKQSSCFKKKKKINEETAIPIPIVVEDVTSPDDMISLEEQEVLDAMIKYQYAVIHNTPMPQLSPEMMNTINHFMNRKNTSSK